LFKYFDFDTSTFSEKLFVEYFTIVEEGGCHFEKEVSIFAGHSLSGTRKSQDVENIIVFKCI